VCGGGRGGGEGCCVCGGGCKGLMDGLDGADRMLIVFVCTCLCADGVVLLLHISSRRI
jgi:hypothetical protein